MDEIIVTDNDPREKKALWQYLTREFEIKELGRLNYFMRIEVAHSKESIFVSQHKHVIDLLKETRKLGCKPVDIPIEPNHKLGKVLEEGNCRLWHILTTNGQTHLLSTSRPDITYAVSNVNQFM